jgi:hypothetical protein
MVAAVGEVGNEACVMAAVGQRFTHRIIVSLWVRKISAHSYNGKAFARSSRKNCTVCTSSRSERVWMLTLDQYRGRFLRFIIEPLGSQQNKHHKRNDDY